MNLDSKLSSNFMQLPFMKRRDTSDSNKKEKTLPLVGRVSNKIRNHFVAMVGEFCGTFMFLFFAFAGTQIANTAAAATTNSNASSPGLPQAPNTSIILYIALSFGFSLMINVWIFFRISGGMFKASLKPLRTTLTPRRTIQPSSYACVGTLGWRYLDSCRPCTYC